MLLCVFAEHVAARFGNEDSHSYAAFIITDDLGQNFSLSLFVRTKKGNGLLLALANSSNSQYLHLWLEDGRVTVKLHNSEGLKAEAALHDGEVHFVSVEVEENQVALFVAGEKQGEVEVSTVSAKAGDAVYVGGLPESTTVPLFGGYFKGCVQDLRINDRRLQFFGLGASVRSYPLELMENVTAGCSGDNTCSVSDMNNSSKHSVKINIFSIKKKAVTSIPCTFKLRFVLLLREIHVSTVGCASPLGTILPAPAPPAQQGGTVRL